MFAPPTLAPFTLLHSLASSIRSILPGDGVTCINQCKSAVIFRLRRQNCQNNCKTTVHFWRNRRFSQNRRKITVLSARPPKSGVLTYKFCVIAVQLIFLCVYIDLWNFEVSSSILTHNGKLHGSHMLQATMHSSDNYKSPYIDQVR